MEKTEMNGEDFEHVAALLRKLPREEVREPNFLQIGGAGYFENATSDLLALFMGLHPAVPRWLGEALVDLLCEGQSTGVAPSWNSATAEREVHAIGEGEKNRGRLDIVVETPEVVVGVENKVYAEVNNPFDIYDALLKSKGRGRRILRCVLVAQESISGSPWPVITYRQLVKRARELLPAQLTNRQPDKWQVLYDELLDHLSSLARGGSLKLEEQLASFVCDNYGPLMRATGILSSFDKALHDEVVQTVSATLASLGVTTSVSKAEGNWPLGRALRVRPDRWGEDSWIVLIYRPCDHGSSQPVFRVRAYVERDTCRIGLDQLQKLFLRAVVAGELERDLVLGEREIWPEAAGRLLGIEVRPKDTSLGGAIEAVRLMTTWVHKKAFAGR